MKSSMKRRRSSDGTSASHETLATPDRSTDGTQSRRSADGTSKKPRLSPLYQYLPAESIRLLSVEEIDGRQIHSLETFRKDEVPDYHALSYCWGKDVRSSTIDCNGHTLNITPCLSNALQEVLKIREGHRPLLWVDAVCLNQDDEDEKAIHVLQMYSIYAAASLVVVWLGDADAETPEAIYQMDRILRKLKKPNLQNLSKFVTDRELLYHDLPVRKDQIWRSIRRLLHRPWFQRLWPLQEMAFAKTVIFRCGPLSTTWSTIRDFVHEVAEDQIVYYLKEIEYLQKISHGNDLDLVEVFQIARNRSCEQPIDRLWAMLGFTGPHFRKFVVDKRLIDYSESGKRDFWESYTAVAKIILLEYDPYLTLLSVAKLRPELPQLPTWCPNWHARESIQRSFEHYGAGLIEGKTAWHSTPQFDADSNLLQVIGCRVDTVADMVYRDWVGREPSLESLVGPDGWAARSLAWDHECRQLSQETMGYDALWEQAYLRTMTYDCKTHDLSYEQLQDQFPIWKGCMEQFVESENTTNDEWNACLPFLGEIYKACTATKFFSTENGRIGIGSTSLLPGDQLGVLSNGSPVYILRRLVNNEDEQSITKYNLVGTAYVDGLMNEKRLNWLMAVLKK